MCFLAAHALAQLAPLCDELELQELPLFLALPEVEGADWDWPALAAVLQRALPQVRLLLGGDSCYQAGRAGLFQALAAAQGQLEQLGQPVLVGAVDSLCDPESIRRLLLQQRLLTGRKDGTIPGEGAGFILVADGAQPAPQGLSPELFQRCRRILGVALAREPQPLASGRASTGGGLSEVLGTLRRDHHTGDRPIDQLVSCQTGEDFFARELAVAQLRNAEMFAGQLKTEVLVDYFGDAGAAAPLLGLVAADWLLGHTSAQRDGLPGRAAVVSSADHGTVGALVMEGAAEGDQLSQSLARSWEAQVQVDQVTQPSQEVRVFHDDFVDEHLEELGYLVYDREEDFYYGGVTWREVQKTEYRIQRHLEALRQYGSAARNGAWVRLHESDDDVQLGAVTFLASSWASSADHATLLNELPDLDHGQLVHWLRGIRWVMHPGLLSALSQQGKAESLPLAVRALVLLGHCRRGDFGELAALVFTEERPLEVREAALRALLKVAPDRALEPALTLASTFPDSVAAAWALACLGHPSGLQQMRWAVGGSAPLPSGMALLLAQAGEPSDAPALRRVLREGGASAELYRALGVMGLPEDVPLLIEGLNDGDDEVRQGAAEAVLWLTGADLTPPGEPKPVRETAGPTVEAEALHAYWEEFQDFFTPGQRYRRGQPFSLWACFGELELNYPYGVRKRALEELQLRWMRPVDFEPDWPCARQRVALEVVRQDLEAALGA
jgi:3-oxoacyl-[acyl-carrier-protein] synthase-1